MNTLAFMLSHLTWRKLFWSGLAIKIVASLLHTALYTYYYRTGDTIAYLAAWSALDKFGDKWAYYADKADLLPPELQRFRYQPRASLFVKIAYPIYRFSFGNRWVMSAVMGMLSFLGCYAAVVVMSSFFMRWPLVVGFFLWPPVVFWGGGISKDALVCLLLFPLVALVLRWGLMRPPRWWEAVFMAVALLVLIPLKYYYAAVVMVVGLAFLITCRIGIFYPMSSRRRAMFFLVLVLALVLPAGFIHPNLSAGALTDALKKNAEKMSLRTKEKSNLLVYWPPLDAPFSFLLNIPGVWLQATFGPFPWLCKTWPMFAQSLCSMLQLVLALAALFRPCKTDPFWVAVVMVYCCAMVLLLGFSSPNYGTLTRYKIASEPFWMAALLYCLISRSPKASK